MGVRILLIRIHVNDPAIIIHQSEDCIRVVMPFNDGAVNSL
jgi:hypothetical protein